MTVFSNPQGRAASAAHAYVAALVELIGDRDPLALMESAPANLAAAVAGLSDAALRRPEREGKWSVIEVVHHLADTELVYAWRFRLPVAQQNTPITGFDQDGWAREFRYRDGNLEELLELQRVVRASNVRFLRSLSPEQLQRTGMHAERGPESVELMMNLAAGHDIVHLRQIERIRKA